MRAALLHEYHRPLELVERPEPEPVGPRDVVVRIGGAGVCATDLHAQDGLMEAAGVQLPRVLGHENAGWVHAVGDGVTAASPGDPVLLYPAQSCGLCVDCRRGREMLCDRHEFTGLSRDGGFADYVLVDERSLIPLPPGVEPAAVAPHADAGITAHHAVKKLLPRLVPGSTAVVIGVGGVGHIALQLLRTLGGSAVVAVDTDERRRRLARELGADEVLERAADVREATNGAGADVVLDFVATDETHAAGIEMLARGGIYSTVGYGGTLSVPSVALGGSAVVAVDTDERRRRLARELGADEVLERAADVREATNGAGADVVLDFVATDETHAAGIEMVARGGIYSTVGYGGTLSVPSVALVVGESTVAGNLVGNWIDLWEVLQLHVRGAVTLRTESHPFEEVNDVLDALRGGDVTGRAVLVP